MGIAELMANYPDLMERRGTGGSDSGTGGVRRVQHEQPVPEVEAPDAGPLAGTAQKMLSWAADCVHDVCGTTRASRLVEMLATDRFPLTILHPIRAVACHPVLEIFAVVRYDDAIQVFKDCQQQGQGPPKPAMRLVHPRQKLVYAAQWSPVARDLLAVACSTGIILWNCTNPATVRFLDSAPVTTISWSPHGDHLAAASQLSSVLKIWDVSRGICTELERPDPISSLLWSKSGRHLLAATTRKVFRVWDSRSWQCEKWKGKRVQCACWSNDGQILLFSVAGGSVIFSLYFGGGSNGDESDEPQPVFDAGVVHDVTHAVTSEPRNMGGVINAMAWDPSNRRLAVTFDGSAGECSGYVAIFRTCRDEYTTGNDKPSVQPCGFISGPAPAAVPQSIQFLDHLPSSNRATQVPGFRGLHEAGALLCVNWLQTRGQNIPYRSDVRFFPFLSM